MQLMRRLTLHARLLASGVAAVFILLILTGCDPMAPRATAFPVIVTSETTPTAIPPTPTARPTRTPPPTLTPDLPPTATAFPCDQDSGEIIEYTDNRSEAAGGENLRYRVYVPPCYNETQLRFPVVILLHGLSYREQQWEDIGAIEALEQGIRLGALPPMILVMPYFGSIGAQNTFPPNRSYETVILDELIPAIERDFCTWNMRDYRAIGGISRGGFWAYSIAFRHPDVFGIAGGHSAEIPDIASVPAAFNPISIAENSSLLPEANLRLYMDNGSGDAAAFSQRTLSDALRERSITHRYVINPVGEHNNEYWSAHVSEYLSFYGEEWPDGYGPQPSCFEPSP